MTKTIQMFNPETNESRPLPVEMLTNYMLAGWIPAEDPTPAEPAERFFPPTETFGPEDVQIYKEDVDASAAVDKDIENAVFEIEHTKENVLLALDNVDILNAAISHLGDLQTEDELAAGETSHQNGAGFSAAFARTGRRLWMWVTGKDPKTMECRWETKCLSHSRATKAFSRQLRNYEDFNSATDLAKYVASFHWKQLGHILEDGFVGISLPKIDKKQNYKAQKSTSWTPLTGAKVLTVKGGGTQILWDSRKVWLPSSQIKNVKGTLSIPSWLAKKNDMV